MKKLADNLFQFSIYIPPMDFTIHQYLLATEPSILFAAGTVQQARSIIPEIRKVLGGRPLDYVFVSHMETDEAGGVFALNEAFPEMRVVCGQLAARELPGWGYEGKLLPEDASSTLSDGELDLQFVDYPAEVHDQMGLLAYERTSGIFYSADLFLRFGNGVGETRKASWADEVAAIDEERVPEDMRRAKLKEDLLQLSPRFVAVGHGFCLDCTKE
jgi:flavorubredoxin